MVGQEKPLRSLFVGFGNVGQRVAEILFVEREQHPNLSPLNLTVVGIVTKSRGSLVNNKGVDVAKALHEIRELGRFSWTNFELTNLNALDAVQQLDYDVLVELSVLSIAELGEPALSYVREALKRGRHVVTANKAPAAFAYHELHFLALKQGVQFLHESTVMDGTPIFNLAQNGLSGCQITGVSGVLNSTTNFVLSRLEQGESLKEAVKIAQKEGFAEADPLHDLEGWDAAAKIAVLANALMGASLTPSGMQAMPEATILCVGSRVMSMPLNTMRPARGGVRPRIERTSVVLPEPFEPSRQVMPPATTVSETPCSTSALS